MIFSVSIVVCNYRPIETGGNHFSGRSAGNILCMCSANERWHYNVTPSLIASVHAQNDPWICHHNFNRLLASIKFWASMWICENCDSGPIHDYFYFDELSKNMWNWGSVTPVGVWWAGFQIVEISAEVCRQHRICVGSCVGKVTVKIYEL